MTNRRTFLGLSGATLATIVASRTPAATGRPRRITAVAFDAFPIFDPRPIGALAEELFPGRGAELMTVWRTRQFEYTWLRTLSGRYQDFWRCTEDALAHAAAATRLELDAAKRKRLMGGFLELQAWPDALGCLLALVGA